MDIIKISVAAVAVCFLALQMQEKNEMFKVLIIMSGGIFLIFFAFDALKEIVSFFYEMTDKLHISLGYITILLKLLGIAYISEFSAGICKDAGCQSLAVQVEMIGKLCILVTGIPLIKAVIKTISEITG